MARAVEGTTLEKWNPGNWVVSSNLTASAGNFNRYVAVLILEIKTPQTELSGGEEFSDALQSV